MTSIKGVLFLKNVDGEMKWFNGDSGNEVKYEGEIENGEPNGLGIMIYPSGSKYVGSWKNGKRHGKGQMTHTDTSSNWGEYKDGVFLERKYIRQKWKHQSKKGEWKNYRTITPLKPTPSFPESNPTNSSQSYTLHNLPPILVKSPKFWYK